DKVSSISQGNYEMDIFYGTDLQRLKQEIRLNQSIVETRFFVGNLYEMLELNGGSQVKKLNYLSGPDGVFAIYIEDEINGNRFNYVLKDHLGSYNVIADENGNKLEELSFDAWGQRRNPNDWKNENVPTSFLFRRGFTGHEHLDEFGLINMNGRVYDDALGRFLSPDPFVQMPDFSQNFNRYSYCLNNPLIFTDPSGEIIWAPIIIGAALGTYMGGAIANEGNFNPFEWDYSSGKTWGYMLGGAIVGGLSGYVGGAIASAEIPMSNTLGIAGSSLTNSIGTNIYTGGETDISISLGVVSYNFTQGEMGYLGKKGNSALENIGYTFGALANLSDAVSLFSGGGQNVDVNSASTKDDWWGHSSITDKNENTLVSIGPDSQVQKAESLSDTWKNSIKGAKIWDSYVGDKGTWSTRINNVSTSAINNYASGITRWDLLLNSCVGHTTKALMRAGIPTIYAFHPHMLNVQLFIRQLGIYSSSYLYQFE
ncbi:MAG: RHS repeat-associated core domain-containing protein, partial [Bacteroidales bacterium]|nr:RHS repeat-associated core domain-containing protein [Bacteroidales bacterium]